MHAISNLSTLGAIPQGRPAQPLAKRTVPTVHEQKLILFHRGQWLKSMIAKCAADSEARYGFEQDLATLRKLYNSMLSEEVIRARCEKLADLKKSLGTRIVDNRIAYTGQTSRAVKALCGGAV